MVLLAIAEENNLDIEFVDTNPGKGLSAEYRKLNPLGRIPTFEAADGWVLTEVIAIAIYLTSRNKSTTLLGKTERDHAQVVRWLSFVNMEVLERIIRWFRPIIGTDPFIQKNVDAAKKATLEVLDILESHFSANDFFVGRNMTLADLFGVSLLSRGFQFVLDKQWRLDNPNTTRWFRTVISHSLGKKIVPRPIFIEEALTSPLPENEALIAQGRG